MPTIAIQLRQERKTKNTIRFAELQNDKGNPRPLIGTLHVQKWAVTRPGNSEALTLRLKAPDPSDS